MNTGNERLISECGLLADICVDRPGAKTDIRRSLIRAKARHTADRPKMTAMRASSNALPYLGLARMPVINERPAMGHADLLVAEITNTPASCHGQKARQRLFPIQINTRHSKHSFGGSMEASKAQKIKIIHVTEEMQASEGRSAKRQSRIF